MPPCTCPRQGRLRSTPRFCSAGANGTNIRQCWSARRKATAIEKDSSKLRTSRGLTCHCADKAGYIYFFSLHIYRVVLLLLRQSWPWRTATSTLPKRILPHPPTTSVLCMAPNAREVRVVKPLSSPVRDTRARATGISCFPCQTATRKILLYVSPHFPALFLPRSPPLDCFFARDCAHAGGPVR
jgi:hypothetical protein